MLAHNNASTETLNTSASSLPSAATSPSASSSSLSQSRSISPSSASGGSSAANSSQSHMSPSPTTNTFGLMTLKTNGNVNMSSAANVVSPALVTTSAATQNTSKILQMFPDAQSPTKSATITNGVLNENGASVKISLPSLVNLGILTPATSPKQHQHTTALQTSPPVQILSNGGSDNNNSTLPLTPVSPHTTNAVTFVSANGNGSDSITAITDGNLLSEDT